MIAVLQASITLLTSGFSKGVSQVIGGMKSMGKAAIAVNQSLALFDRFMNGVVGRLATLGNSFLQTASKFDMLKITLDTLTKGKGEEWFQKLSEWALKMPVDFEQGVKSFQQLIAMGINPTTAQMTVLVDTVSALGGHKDTLDRIAKALGQMQTTGYIHAQDIFQLAQVGIPVVKYLEQYTDLTQKQIANIGEYKIRSEEVIKAIIYGLSQTFGGQSARVMDKFQGQIETIINLWQMFQYSVMQSGPMAFIEATLKRVIDYVEELRRTGEFDDIAKSIGKAVTEWLEWIVSLGEEVWANRDRVVKFFADLKAGAESAWPVIKSVAETLGSVATATASVVSALPGDGASSAAVGLLTARLFGSPIGLSLIHI